MCRAKVIVFALMTVLAVWAVPEARADAVSWACPRGSALVGFKGVKGVWIDAVAGLCSPWVKHTDGYILDPPPDPNGSDFHPRSSNDAKKDEQCEPNMAVTSIRFGFAHPSDDESDLQNLQTQCTNVVNHIASDTWHTELVSDSGAPTDGSACSAANTVANGLRFQVGNRGLSGLELNCVQISQIIAEAFPPPEVIDPRSLPPLAVLNQSRSGELNLFESYGVDTPTECAQICSREPACKAWTYIKKGVKYPLTAECQPAGGVILPQADFCCVAGVVSPPGSALNTDRPGSDLANVALADTDPNLCADACLANAQCKAWTYANPGVHGVAGPRCYLKNSVAVAVKDNCCVSGTPVRVLENLGGASKLGETTAMTGAQARISDMSQMLSSQQAAGGPADQTLSVRCTSTGEACNIPAAVNLPDGSWTVRVFSPAAQCSPIRYRLTTDNHGDLIGDSGALAPGAASLTMPVPATTRQIYISATGITGGCNKGTLSAWGVVVRLTPR